MKKRHLWNLAAKIMLVILVSILPINIFALTMIYSSTQNTEKQIELSLESIANMYTIRLDNQMKQVDLYLYDLYTNDSDCIMMCKENKNENFINARYRLKTELDKAIYVYGDADGIFFYKSDTEDLIFNMDNACDSSQKAWESYLSSIDEQSIDRKWNLVEIEDEFWLFRCTNIKSVYYGAFINLTSIQQEMEDGISYKSCKATFSSSKDEEESLINVSAKSSKANMYIGVSVQEKEVLENMLIVEKGRIIVAIIYLGLIPFLIFFLQRNVVKPLKELQTAHNQLETGNPEYRIRKQANTNEFQAVYHSFNSMADNIHDLKVENMEKELAKQKLMLNNLQLQIRPHFLLNTFNLIYSLAGKNQIEPVKKMILYLSEYFRYLFRSGKELELVDKELHLIEAYIETVQIRYPGEVEISYLVDPEIRMVRIPPLLLHNFVENIINHAKEVGKLVHIMICAEYENGMVQFQISDDGIGMNEETIMQINAGNFKEDGGRVHVGLKNSMLRLKYFYGDKAGIHVDSEKGSGTVFSISFSYQSLEEEFDETIDGE